MAILPSEGDSILLVDPQAERSGSIALQRLQAVAGREPEILQGSRPV